jgi:hypothetical protein
MAFPLLPACGRLRRASVLVLGAGVLASCGGRIAAVPSASRSASGDSGDGGDDASVLWTYVTEGDAVDLVQSRDGTLYTALHERLDAAPWSAAVVAALDPGGRELWRANVPDTSVGSLMTNRAGDLWAIGTGLTRIAKSGTIVWHSTSSNLLGWRGALAPDGTAYVYCKLPGDLQVYLQAISPDGSPGWRIGLGGTLDSRESTPTPFGPPAIAPLGQVIVPCLSCQRGLAWVALDPHDGALAASTLAPVDGGVLFQPGSGVVVDAEGNTYFAFLDVAAGSELASATESGALRWITSATEVRAAASPMELGPLWPPPAPPVLIGAAGLVGNSPAGFVELAADGTVGTSVAAAEMPALTAILAGSEVLAQVSVNAGNPGAFGTGTAGSGILDARGQLVWFDSSLDAASVIPGPGVVYGIKNAQVVAETAPVAGLDSGDWPMVAHDPGRTSSCAGTW